MCIKPSRGFTLLEVMVALLIFGMIGMVAVKAASQYVYSYERARDKTMAGWVAENRMTEYRLSGVTPEVSETTSEVAFGQNQWEVKTRILSTLVPSIYRVEVDVAKYVEGHKDPVPLHTLASFVGGGE